MQKQNYNFVLLQDCQRVKIEIGCLKELLKSSFSFNFTIFNSDIFFSFVHQRSIFFKLNQSILFNNLSKNIYISNGIINLGKQFIQIMHFPEKYVTIYGMDKKYRLFLLFLLTDLKRFFIFSVLFTVVISTFPNLNISMCHLLCMHIYFSNFFRNVIHFCFLSFLNISSFFF